MSNLIPEKEIAVHSKENVDSIISALIDEGYVVMLSREEDLYMINYIWSQENYADRNNVVFMNREEFEYRYYERVDDEGET